MRDIVPRFHAITRGSDVLGYIAIDSTVGGRARGGLRLVPDLTPNEVRAAAHAMTLKYGFLGLPQGGAKAGVTGDPELPQAQRRERLRAFADAARPMLLAGEYIPDADLGTRATDIRTMMESIGARVGPRDWQSARSGEYTARSAFACAEAVAAHLGFRLAGATVAVEGFGQVGAPLAQLLAAAGARVVAISTSHGALHNPAGLDIERLISIAEEKGSRFVLHEPGRIDRGELLELPLDMLLPCARYHSIHRANGHRIQARAICAGANDPVSPEAEQALIERDIVYPPDFVSNCGGVLGGTLEYAGVSVARTHAIVGRVVRRKMAALLERSRSQSAPLRRLAESEALARHARVRARTESPDWRQRMKAAGVEAYRRGWIPPALMGLIAPWFVAAKSHDNVKGMKK